MPKLSEQKQDQVSDEGPVLWKQVLADDNEPESPVLFKQEFPNSGTDNDHQQRQSPPQRQKEDLYKLYEQLTGPFQELTFKDLVAASSKASLASPAYSVAVPRNKNHKHRPPSAPSSPEFSIQTPRRSLQEEMPKPPYSPINSSRSPRLKDGSRVSPTPSYDAGNAPKIPVQSRKGVVVEHGTSCHTCKTGSMLLKTRCLVCGKVYCRICVKEAMGSMLEGRKCRSCLGHRFNQRYISRAGKGWWLSSRVRQVELRWAKKRPKPEILHMSSRSLQYSVQNKSF